jgi:superfamily II DNA or RNA helicase
MLVLRDYQTIAIRQVFDCWRSGARSVVLVIPTGSGKRLCALWLMDYAAKAGRRVLFVGNRRLLVTQAQNDAERLEHGPMASSCPTPRAAIPAAPTSWLPSRP